MVVPNVRAGMPVTVSGLTATIGTGMCCIRGRFIEVTDPEDVAIPANSRGFLVITVDLTKRNSSSGEVGTAEYIVENNQIRAEFVTTLVQQDINATGTGIYTLNLGTIVSVATSATYTRYNPTYSSYAALQHPVGNLYQSVDSTSPASLFGGSWVAVEAGRYIRAALNANTGGEARHTHTSAPHSHPIPGHSHTVNNHAHAGPRHTHTGPLHQHALAGYAYVPISFGENNWTATYQRGQNRSYYVNRILDANLNPRNFKTTEYYSDDLRPSVDVLGNTGPAGTGNTGAAGDGPTGGSAPGTSSVALTTQSVTPGATGSAANQPLFQNFYSWYRTA